MTTSSQQQPPEAEDRRRKRFKRPPVRKKLTKKVVDAARFVAPEPRPGSKANPRSAFYVWDTATAGFGLRVYPSGRKVFVVTYRVRGKQRFHTIGRYGELGIEDARAEAHEVLGGARKGKDPSAVRLAGRKAPTVQALRDRYMQEHAPTKKPISVENDERNWRLYILPKLGHRRVADLTRDDIEGFRPQLADRPATFNAVRRLLSCALNLAEVWGWRPEGSNPCRHVKRLKVASRDRHLSQGELVRLADAMTAAERTGFINPRAVTAIRLLLLTGCRCGEIRKLRWVEVDFDGKCLRLPDSKTGAKVVYLNSPALEVLAGIEPDAENPYVFPGGKAGEPIADLKTPWRKLRKSVGLEDVWLHDLRRTFASLGVGMGLSLQMVGKLLGHSHITTTQIYAHLDDDPVRQANERIGEEIAAVMLGRPKAEVLAIGAPAS